VRIIDRLVHPNFLVQQPSPSELVRLATSNQALPAGQYAFAHKVGDDCLLIRDPLGLNKLFYGWRADGVLVVASRIDTALSEGVPLDDLASALPGRIFSVRTKESIGNDLSDLEADADFDLAAHQARVQWKLTAYFDYLARLKPAANFVICLSGGLDSTVIANLAAARLPKVSAACFSYLRDEDFPRWLAGEKELDSRSDDFRTASSIAEQLNIDLVSVFRPRSAVAAAVPTAIKLCQDWRDFNVHCAVVNLFLAESLRAYFPSDEVVVLTGDLMNEFVCDYHEEVIDGVTYYPQPRMAVGNRRRFFVRGLDAGDREVGVFNAFGLPLCQVFACVAEDYMKIPTSLLGLPDAKHLLNGFLLPPNLLTRVSRVKQRAQVGGADGGTLALFHRLGLRQTDLMRLWQEQLPQALRGDAPADIIQFGRYRASPRRG
jgi:asparagine synthetase B (glutamine-hydrolysing)